VGVSERLAVAGIVGLPVLGNEHPASPYCTPYCFYFQYALPSITGLIMQRVFVMDVIAPLRLTVEPMVHRI
ncbi:MAG TPA: hypothetical protein V6C65_02470, partial [Allocoleopsis sp.]